MGNVGNRLKDGSEQTGSPPEQKEASFSPRKRAIASYNLARLMRILQLSVDGNWAPKDEPAAVGEREELMQAANAAVARMNLIEKLKWARIDALNFAIKRTGRGSKRAHSPQSAYLTATVHEKLTSTCVRGELYMPTVRNFCSSEMSSSVGEAVDLHSPPRGRKAQARSLRISGSLHNRLAVVEGIPPGNVPTARDKRVCEWKRKKELVTAMGFLSEANRLDPVSFALDRDALKAHGLVARDLGDFHRARDCAFDLIVLARRYAKEGDHFGTALCADAAEMISCPNSENPLKGVVDSTAFVEISKKEIPREYEEQFRMLRELAKESAKESIASLWKEFTWLVEEIDEVAVDDARHEVYDINALATRVLVSDSRSFRLVEPPHELFHPADERGCFPRRADSGIASSDGFKPLE